MKCRTATENKHIKKQCLLVEPMQNLRNLKTYMRELTTSCTKNNFKVATKSSIFKFLPQSELLKNCWTASKTKYMIGYSLALRFNVSAKIG